MDEPWLSRFIRQALEEDLGDGDHSSLAAIDAEATGSARLIIKEHGILAGLEVARKVFFFSDPGFTFRAFLDDGAEIKPGDTGFEVTGKVRSILRCERLVLNIMQRMSGIATLTREYARQLEGFPARLLDTRKTTPGMRPLEKMAVRIGGGENHRMGLYDMIMLKDNHIDYAGGIPEAIRKTREYLRARELDLNVEIEARTLGDVLQILETGGVDRILLDNFSPGLTAEAVRLIGGKMETESSGGITLENIRDYAATGVDFISVGALTHQIRSLDMSLKAIKP